MKTQIAKEKVEVVKQVKLTAKQRFTLVQMSNNDGRYQGYGMDYNVRADLQALGLIEERPRNTPEETKAIQTQIKVLWKSLIPMVRQKSLGALDKAVEEIQAKTRELSAKTWWLTDAANEYLVKGSVVITR